MFNTIKIIDVKKEIGQLVKSLRKRNDLTQKELAESLDLSRITIQNLESGKNFTIDTLLKVLQHLELLTPLHQEIKSYKDEINSLKSLY